MTTLRLSRILIALFMLLFAGVAIAFWIAPEAAAQRFGLAVTGAAGAVSLRADGGGLFAGLALLCALTLITRRAPFAIAAAGVLCAIVAGRLLAWLAQGGPAGDVSALFTELAAIAALALGRHASDDPRPARHQAWRRPLAIAGAMVVLLGAAASAAMMSPTVGQAIFDRAARQRTSNVNIAPLEDDALRVAVCGSSAPLPSDARAKSCVAVFAGGKFYVVDAGPESVENLVLWQIPLSAIGGVLLTHFHSDHIGDLGELNLQTWAGGRSGPLTVYGGPGVEQVVAGFNDAYRLDQGYRTAHHGERVMPSATWPMLAKRVELAGAPTPAKNRSAVVLDDGALRITAIEVDHAPIAPAYAYRFDYKGRSAVVTGDLKFHPPLAVAAKGADLLVSEAIAVEMTRALGAGARSGGRERTAAIMHDIEDYHITPEQAAQIANEAGVKLLVFYHLLPSPDSMLMRRVFTQGVSRVRSEGWAIAEDGSFYTMPLGSDRIERGRIGE